MEGSTKRAKTAMIARGVGLIMVAAPWPGRSTDSRHGRTSGGPASSGSGARCLRRHGGRSRAGVCAGDQHRGAALRAHVDRRSPPGPPRAAPHSRASRSGGLRLPLAARRGCSRYATGLAGVLGGGAAGVASPLRPGQLSLHRPGTGGRPLGEPGGGVESGARAGAR